VPFTTRVFDKTGPLKPSPQSFSDYRFPSDVTRFRLAEL